MTGQTQNVACYPETPKENYEKEKLLKSVIRMFRESPLAYSKKRPKRDVMRGFLMGKEIDLKKLTYGEIGLCCETARCMQQAEQWAGQANGIAIMIGTIEPITMAENI